MRGAKWLSWMILAAVACLSMPEKLEAMAEGPSVAKLISVQGQVAVRRGGTDQWDPAQVSQLLYAGDAVRTGQNSRAAILCIDESQLRLNENTIVILKSIAPSTRLQPVTPTKEAPPPASHYEVPEGEIWLRNKHEKFRFELDTPAVTATIRGTELNVRVKPNGSTSVILLEGNICIRNSQGEVCLRPGEEGYAIPGRKPDKRLLVHPADAVQWVLYYPGIFSYRDLPLAALPPEARRPAGPPAVASLVQQGEAAYDRGRLEEARRDADAALRLAPDNSRALTLLGWISLQRGAPEQALEHFRRAKQPDDLTSIGEALARYRLGEVTGAYDYIQPACRKPRPPALLATMCGYFALMAGKVDEARLRLEQVPQQGAVTPLARSLLSQIYLVQNRKDLALKEAKGALAGSPDSPVALVSLALVKMAYFDLQAAIRDLEKAIQVDPHFVPAYVYLAKIWLGSEYLSRAQRTIDKALQMAPHDPQVLSLAGFVRLAYRDYSNAFQYWNRSIRLDPRFGEPHLGLGIYHYRYREFSQGLEEMLTASLLDPRVASYQTELGKALFQGRAFDRALEVFDYAKTLDPRDPSPYFYKGIALTDLNRPGEAIQEINKSIELNDNVAMFRSRSLLDQDQAVRNTSLARSYQQLGLNDWAFSKAVTAINYNPYDSSAHLFLRDTLRAARFGAAAPFLTAGLLFPAESMEGVLFRVLSRANQGTFQNFQFAGLEYLGLTTDYAPMFEMPYARAGAMGGIGGSRNGKTFQDHAGFLYGGLPGAAFEVSGSYTNDHGFPQPTDQSPNSFNGKFRAYEIETGVKWEPTVQGTLTGFFQYADQKTNEQTSTVQVASATVRGNEVALRRRLYELAYYYRFNPNISFLAYFAHNDPTAHSLQSTDANSYATGSGFPFFGRRIPLSTLDYLNTEVDQEFNNVQVQQHLILSFLGNHNLTAGVDYYSSNVSQRARRFTQLTYDFTGVFPFFVPVTFSNSRFFDFRPPFWSYSFYLQDYWRPHRNLVLEWSLWKDFQKDPREGFNSNIYTSMWSPRFGANYMFRIGETQHVLRAVAERHLTTHLNNQGVLVPAEIAGFPWAIAATTGSEVRQAGGAWEAQWNNKTFTALRLNALRVATPEFATNTRGVDERIYLGWKRYQASLVLNRILLPSLGVSLGVLGKRVIPDLAFTALPLESYSELNAFLGLGYMHPQGWLARVTPLLVQQYGKIQGHASDNPFVILNLTLGREFPNKRGFALFEIQNLFNRQVFYSLEPSRTVEFNNARRFIFRLALYF